MKTKWHGMRCLLLTTLWLTLLLSVGTTAVAAPSPQDNDPCAQCAAGVRLFRDDQLVEALPLLEAGFAGRENATCAAPDDVGVCALALGLVRNRMGDQTGTLKAYRVALEIFRNSGNRALEGTTLNNVGSMYDTQGRYAEAIEVYQQALVIRREVGDQKGEGTTLNNIGWVYHVQQRYAKALEMYHQALAIRREVDDREGEVITLINIGDVYDAQESYAEALAMYQQALAILREIGDQTGEGTALNSIGDMYQAQGQYARALGAYQQALVIRRATSDRAGEGTTLHNIGDVYESQGRYAEALKMYQQSLVIRQRVGDRPGRGSTLNSIGVLYLHQGRYAEALKMFQQSLVIQQEVGNRAGRGSILNNIGGVYQAQGRYDKALESFRQALTIDREMGNRSTEGTTLNNIGGAYYLQGRYAEALKVHQQALIIHREVKDRPMEGTTISNIGLVYHAQGYYAKALEMYQQALVIQQEIGGRAGVGIISSNIGGVYNDQGRYAKALEMYRQALVVHREIHDRVAEGATLNNIGVVYQAQGRYAEALESLQQALAIRREVGNRAEEGAALNNIGGVYQAQGRDAEALEMYQQALDIVVELGNRDSEGAILGNIASMHHNRGHYAEALEICQQALVIQREVGDRKGEGTTLNNIGGVYQAQERYAKALEMYQQALAIRREVGDRVGEETTLNNIGGVYNDQGRYAKALEIYRQALAIHRETGSLTGEGIVLSNIGSVYQVQERYTEAMVAYQQAIDAFEAVRTTAGSEQGRASFIAQYASLYVRAAGLFHQQGQDEAAFFTSERGRARAFLDSLATGHVELTDDEAAALLAQEQEAYARRQAAQDALVRARALDASTGSGQAPPDPALVADLEAQLAEAETSYAQALAAIEARGDQLAALVPGRSTVLGLSDVQALLDEETTLLSYFVLEDQTLAFLITRSSFETTVIDVSRQELIDRVSYFRDVIPFRQPEATHPAARELYQLLIAPLAASLPTSRLAIIPHGPLHYLPFAALVAPDTGRILLEHYALITLPSASALSFILENAEEQRSRGAEEQGEGLSPTRPYPHTYTLILGNPATGDPDLEPLLFAEREAQAIAELYDAQPLLGEAATESAVRERASRASILHLATHGGYNSHNPLYSAIALAPDAETDGRLEVHEIYGLDLAKTDLVVLSACQTQLGELSAGDELVGLTRAFFFAGAPTVIATLWSVDDEATGLLMERFYTHLREGMDKATALRQAQLEVREAYPAPYYWAGFALSGDGGDVSEDEILAPTPVVTSTVDQAPQETPVLPSEPGPPNPPRWVWLIVGGTLLIVVAVGAVIWWRRASQTNAQPHPRDRRPGPEHRNEFRHPS